MQRYFSKSQKRFIWKRDRGVCGICGFGVKGEWHADHIWPWALDGATIVKNGQIAHPKCNLWKKAKVNEHIYNNWAWEIWYGYRSKKLERWRNEYYEEYPEYDYENWDRSYDDEEDYVYDWTEDYSYDSYDDYSYQSSGYNIADDIYAVSNTLGKVSNWLSKR